MDKNWLRQKSLCAERDQESRFIFFIFFIFEKNPAQNRFLSKMKNGKNLDADFCRKKSKTVKKNSRQKSATKLWIFVVLQCGEEGPSHELPARPPALGHLIHSARIEALRGYKEVNWRWNSLAYTGEMYSTTAKPWRTDLMLAITWATSPWVDIKIVNHQRSPIVGLNSGDRDRSSNTKTVGPYGNNTRG